LCVYKLLSTKNIYWMLVQNNYPRKQDYFDGTILVIKIWLGNKS